MLIVVPCGIKLVVCCRCAAFTNLFKNHLFSNFDTTYANPEAFNHQLLLRPFLIGNSKYSLLFILAYAWLLRTAVGGTLWLKALYLAV